jgi:hypothetical protein
MKTAKNISGPVAKHDCSFIRVLGVSKTVQKIFPNWSVSHYNKREGQLKWEPENIENFQLSFNPIINI